MGPFIRILSVPPSPSIVHPNLVIRKFAVSCAKVNRVSSGALFRISRSDSSRSQNGSLRIEFPVETMVVDENTALLLFECLGRTIVHISMNQE